MAAYSENEQRLLASVARSARGRDAAELTEAERQLLEAALERERARAAGRLAKMPKRKRLARGASVSCQRCGAPTPGPRYKYCSPRCRGIAVSAQARRVARGPQNQQRATWPSDIEALNARLLRLIEMERIATPQQKAVVKPLLRKAGAKLELLKMYLLQCETRA